MRPRQKASIKDIELVVIPKWTVTPGETPTGNLFELTPPLPLHVNELHRWATKVQSSLTWIKPGTQEIIPWEPKPDGKYWRATLVGPGKEMVKLDLFLTRPQNWGIIYLIRTGAAEFSAAVLGHAKRNTPHQSESSYYAEHGMASRGRLKAIW